MVSMSQDLRIYTLSRNSSMLPGVTMLSVIIYMLCNVPVSCYPKYIPHTSTPALSINKHPSFLSISSISFRSLLRRLVDVHSAVHYPYMTLRLPVLHASVARVFGPLSPLYCSSYTSLYSVLSTRVHYTPLHICCQTTSLCHTCFIDLSLLPDSPLCARTCVNGYISLT